ncbi:MAG: OmpA family protein [Bacteroidales bacterium]|nr:OmpA family protein [Bacteroidales bacterium]
MHCKFLIAILLIVTPVDQFAQQESKSAYTDHPLYARREHAEIVSKEVRYTNKYYLIKKYREVTEEGEILVNDFELISIKGKLTRIKYFVPKWRLYTEHDSLLKRFCQDLIFMHEYVSPFKRNLNQFAAKKDGYYTALGEAMDKIPEDNYYFVLSRFKNGKKVYVVITGSYKHSREGSHYTVDVIETNERRFITVYEIGRYLRSEGSVNITSILFETNSATIMEESYDDVRFLAEFLESVPDFKIKIAGHTDSVGNDDYNQKLSERRAASLKRMLVQKHGIESSRIGTLGFGESKPIADNETVHGRALNRRVEIIKME